MKKSILLSIIGIAFSSIFCSCEKYDENLLDKQSDTFSKTTLTRMDIASIYVSVQGPGEIYVSTPKGSETIQKDELKTLEVSPGDLIKLSTNEEDSKVFDGWYIGGEKVSDQKTYEVKATYDLEIKAVFGKTFTLNMVGNGNIKVNGEIIYPYMCPYSLFLAGDESSVLLEEVPNDEWTIACITGENENIPLGWLDMETSKTVTVTFSEFTRYLRIIESPKGVNFNDYTFEITGYEYVSLDYTNPNNFHISSQGIPITQTIGSYIQNRGLAITFSNNTTDRLKVEVKFEGNTKEFILNTIEYIELKSANYQEDRLITLDIKISKY